MNQPNHDILSLSTIADLVRYISARLKERGSRPDESVAATIVALGINEHIDKWCQEDVDLNTIISLCSDLEWSNGTPEGIQDDWREIEVCIKRLEQRYT
jgi:hypothetical protein